MLNEVSNEADGLISRSRSCVLLTSNEADGRMSRSTRRVLMVGAAVVVTVATVVVMVMVASRSGSAGSNVSTALFRGASGLLHGVGEPLRLPVAAPSPASDELEDAEPSNSVYSCKEKCKFLNLI